MAKDLNVSLGLLAQEFRRGLKQVKRDLQKFSRQMDSIGRQMTTSLSVPLGAAGLAAIKSAADFEKLEAILKATSKSAIPVEQQLINLKRIAEAPGLGFEQAVRASARLQALNLTAEQAEEVITQFGNAVARSGGGAAEFDGVSLALGQIISKGKVTAEEINQLNERIFEIRPALINAFGTADTEALQKLGISSEEFVAKITQEFAKLERVGPTLANTFENLGVNIKIFLSEIGKEILKVVPVQSILERFGDFLSNLSTRFSNLSDPVKRTIITVAGLAAAIGPVILGISGLASGLAVFLTPLGLTVTAIAGLTAGFVALYNNNEVFRLGVQRVGDYLKAAFSVALKNTKSLLVGIRSIVSVVIDRFKAFRSTLGDIGINGSTLLKPLITTLKVLGTAALLLYKTFNGVRVGIIRVFTELVKIAFETVGSFKEAFASLKDGDFTAAFTSLRDGFRNLNPITLAIDEGKRLGESFLSGLQDGFANDPLTRFYNDLQQEIKDQAAVTKEVATKENSNIFNNDSNGSGVFANNFNRGGQGQGASTATAPEGLGASLAASFGAGLISQQSQFATGLQSITEQIQVVGNALSNVSGAAFGASEIAANAATSAIQKAAEQQARFNKQLSIAGGITTTLAPAFDKVFDTIISGGKNAFKSFTDSIKQILVELGKAILKAAIFAGVTALITGGASTFATGFKGLLGQFTGLGRITNLADGGIIPNRTFLTGEEGAEAVIPLDRGAAIPVKIEVEDIKISGTDLVLVMRQSQGITDRLFG